MFRIDSQANSIARLDTRTFSDLGIRERANLQEWIVKTPDCLGEDLLIIQKEYAGFPDTNERLDLLAIDKKGSLVIIENKLDDAGRDVTWQALKYASYCSGLSKESVCRIYQEFLDKSALKADASIRLSEFLEEEDYDSLIINQGFTQRIILIAANFRKEVTSAVLWLLNFKLRVQCFRVVPYSMGDERFLTIEQIIPVKNVEAFMIGLADKARDEIEGVAEEKNRHKIRREFWLILLRAISGKTNLFQNISPGTQNWLGAASGVRGVAYNFVAGKAGGRVELYIDRGEKLENEFVFDQLFLNRESIENTFGSALTWERLDDKRACRIKSEIDGNIFERDSWPLLIDSMTTTMVKMEATFKGWLIEIPKKLRNKAEA